MFQYFYRIFDLYDKQIYALAIFTSEISSLKMNSYHYDFFGTIIDYHYHTYRNASQSEFDLLQSNNPFAIAVLAGLYVSKSKKNNHLKYKYKRKLMRLLLQDTMKKKEVNREYIQKLFIFIDYILRLPKKAEDKLYQEIIPLVEKEETGMGLSLENTPFAKFLQKQKAIEIATRLLQNGFSVEEVVKYTGLEKEDVCKIQKGIEQ
ncbi:hypothetical protein [Niallia oryzisoli]|uniref:hypothetical protein n=1 Tax=Niallia oryzisoli TaxID=1737571 RepID=UPI0037362367